MLQLRLDIKAQEGLLVKGTKEAYNTPMLLHLLHHTECLDVLIIFQLFVAFIRCLHKPILFPLSTTAAITCSAVHVLQNKTLSIITPREGMCSAFPKQVYQFLVCSRMRFCLCIYIVNFKTKVVKYLRHRLPPLFLTFY